MSCFHCFRRRERENSNNRVDRRPRVIEQANLRRPVDRPATITPTATATASSSNQPKNFNAKIFKYHELAAATGDFHPRYLVGEGGFGRVYKGRLQDTGQEVAIKRLDPGGVQGTREFLLEVLMLTLLEHEHFVDFVGFCCEGDHCIVVYEYLELGSLDKHLFDLAPDATPLSWATRMKIAAGIAKGLEYLHHGTSPPIVYRDLKSANVLLDNDYFPKISDFGLARTGPVGDQTHVTTRVMGTYGYCAPDYAMTGHLTIQSDVYSFGVVLLELITGRKAMDRFEDGEVNLVLWARPRFTDPSRFTSMVDPLLRGQYPKRGLYQVIAVAALCVQDRAALRPLMGDVVTALSHVATRDGTSTSRPSLLPLPPLPPWQGESSRAAAAARRGDPTDLKMKAKLVEEDLGAVGIGVGTIRRVDTDQPTSPVSTGPMDPDEGGSSMTRGVVPSDDDDPPT